MAIQIINVQQINYINNRLMIIVALLWLIALQANAQPPCLLSIWFVDTCVYDCPANYYYSNENGYYQCKQCDVARGYIPNAYRIGCVCAKQRYLDSYGECAACHSSCFTCSGPGINDCLTCDTQVPYSNRVMQSGACVCQPGFAENIYNSLKCDKCHSDCATCGGPNDFECITCASNRVFDEYSNCVCVNWMVPDANGNCICPFPLILDTYGKCVLPSTSCGLNEEMKAARVGKPPKLPSNPQSNSQGLSCQCKTGYYRVKGVCQQCGENQYYETWTGRCQCIAKAIKIKNGSCIICPTNMVFNRKTQQCDCLKNQFKTQTGQCIKCPPKSTYRDGACRCIFNYYQNSTGKCTKCNSGFDNPLCQEVETGFQRHKQLTFKQI